MAADRERSADVYCAAASEEQADRVFDAMKPMIELSDTLAHRVGLGVTCPHCDEPLALTELWPS